MPPTKYRADFPARALELMRNGASLCEVAADLGISEETIHVWKREGKRKHTEFITALEQGKALSEAWWTRLGREAAAGKVPGFQPAAWIFSMRNRFGWRNDDRTELVGKGGAPIQISWPLQKTELDV